MRVSRALPIELGALALGLVAVSCYAAIPVVLMAIVYRPGHWEQLLALMVLLAVAPFIIIPGAMLLNEVAKNARAIGHAPGHCRHCGYDLTGTRHERCPECGRS